MATTSIKRLCCLALCLFLAAAPARAATVSFLYPAEAGPIANPFIGNMVWASADPEHEQPFRLVYADLTWAEFEPKRGEFDFDAFESKNRFDHWRAEGAHVVLRFVMDKPTGKKHMDIPDWLYDETGDGTRYRTEYGRGYSPNYDNERLIEAHEGAIRALGARYDKDPLIAFVQLGSLGHWGEWHVHPDAGRFPLEPVRERYVAPYAAAFSRAKLMFRRPFTHAARHGAGLYNDTAAREDSTETWLNWIGEGGAFDQTGEERALVPMPDAWQTSPIGGELATSEDREDLLGAHFERTLSLMLRSHASWIGPGSFSDIERGGESQQNLDALMARIGYRIRVSRLDIVDAPGALRLTFTFCNDGSAPFYFDWRPTVRVLSGGVVRMHALPLDIRTLLPGAPQSVSLTLPKSALPEAECTLQLGILDPSTQSPGIRLAMQTPVDANWHTLALLTP